MNSNILFITGTDTGVGKTVATVILSHAFQKMGLSIKVMKPIISGPDHDRAFICKFLDLTDPPEIISPYVLAPSLSPHLAAKIENRKININNIIDIIQNLSQKCDLLIIEGIGGIMVPLTYSYNILNLIKDLNSELIIVAANKIGVLNHTLLTCLAAKFMKIEPLGFILNNLPSYQDESTPFNKDELIKLTSLKCWGDIPCIPMTASALKTAVNNLSHEYLKKYAQTLESQLT